MRRLLPLLFVFISTLTIAAGKGPQMPPPAVNTITTKYSTWQMKVPGTGNLLASQGTTIKSEAAGRVYKILFKSGDYVEKGTPLVALHQDVLKAQLALYTAKYKLSQTDYARKKDLVKRNAISQSELDSALAELQTNQASVNEIQAQIDQMIIKAPFSGRLGLRKISLGDFLSPGEEVVNLQATQPIFVDFDIPEQYMSQVRVGQTIEFSSHAFDNKPYKATVMAVESAINPSSQSLSIRAEVTNPNSQMIPGTFVNTLLYIGKPEQVIMIPQTALVYSDKGPFVYRVVNDKAIQTPVLVKQQLADKALISDGLKPNEVVITAGQLKVQPGAKVMIVPSQANKSSKSASNKQLG